MTTFIQIDNGGSFRAVAIDHIVSIEVTRFVPTEDGTLGFTVETDNDRFKASARFATEVEAVERCQAMINAISTSGQG